MLQAAHRALALGHRQREFRAPVLQGPQPGRPPPRIRSRPDTSRTSRSSASSKTSAAATCATRKSNRCSSLSGTRIGRRHVLRGLRGSAEAAFASIRALVAQVDPALPVSLRTFEDQIDRSLRTERMLATLSSGFGAIALLLSVVGLYGVMSFVVTKRTQEIGVRLALGATRSAAVWLVVRDALMMIAAGTAVALPCRGPSAAGRSAALRRSRVRRADHRARERSAGAGGAGAA